ncbi:phasin family protein [Zoogloea dura]|uniref:Phasin family protein n=1 Tax=Zoogloea dura TaxID=2728840 RepID=A0A848G675_9RHOO|nr:phasin family protein [Zoogloea dura]NML25141.1 phasin family protein [Zoogloea dura]
MITLESMLANPGKDNLDAVSSLYLGAFVAAQRLVALNIRATQSLMESNMSSVQALARARNLENWQEAQSAATQQLVNQIVGYAGDFNEVVAENQKELTSLLQAAPPVPASGKPAANLLAMSEVVQTMLDAALHSRNAMLDMAMRVDQRRQDAAPES